MGANRVRRSVRLVVLAERLQWKSCNTGKQFRRTEQERFISGLAHMLTKHYSTHQLRWSLREH